MCHHFHSSSQLPCEIGVITNLKLGNKIVFKSFNFQPKITELINSGGTGTQTQVSAVYELMTVGLGC